jgi:hypothetical protein
MSILLHILYSNFPEGLYVERNVFQNLIYLKKTAFFIVTAVKTSNFT